MIITKVHVCSSVYTAALLHHIFARNLKLTVVFEATRIILVLKNRSNFQKKSYFFVFYSSTYKSNLKCDFKLSNFEAKYESML